MQYRRWLALSVAIALIVLATPGLATTIRSTRRMAGFSSDSQYYVYLETSRNLGSGIPKAVLQVIDIADSTCVAGGCLETRYGESDSNLSVRDAETDLLQQTWTLRQELGLTPPVAGIPLTIASRSRTADGTETVNVNLGDRRSVRLVLQQRAEPSRAAFRLEAQYAGQRRSLGSLSRFLNGILRYSIREVYASPDEDSIVVLLTAMRPAFEGTLETTLVQSFELRR
ncbi:DUF2259 domain-containing protein [Oscillatoria sp. FACHB-1407]|uniref:DUF2259 domain-containing protein n=1 Tax=Oscillatoria sp. FACHB-1407 TaxID=2692847 RepID=UPI00168552FA|nr:DUF2259 domain-containing protein [Oscillatoria sp. FACHB-1407]MBD2465633.1 DUF2259 domain-containing protein [Oscillatoria sp. FACHB-1407]